MRTLTACVVLPLLAACGLHDGSTPAPEPAPSVPLAGTYQVTTRFELPAADVAPGPLGDALGVVHGLAVNPGGALLDLAESAGVPAVEELRLVLPSSLEERLEGWITEHLEIVTVDGTSPLSRVAELDALIRSVLLEWELRSTLDLPAGGAGTHAPVALAFAGPAGPTVIPVSATAPVTAAAGVTATVSWPGGAAHAAVVDHAMGVPFGHYALEAAEILLEARYGTADPRAVLGGLVDCGAVGADVASRCVGLVCVGHAEEVQAVCEGGLDAAADQLVARVLALDYEAIRLDDGAAAAEEAAVDLAAGVARAGRLAGGVWAATVDLGEGPIPAVATFAATRD